MVTLRDHRSYGREIESDDEKWLLSVSGPKMLDLRRIFPQIGRPRLSRLMQLVIRYSGSTIQDPC
jgi:hypothetical protein